MAKTRVIEWHSDPHVLFEVNEDKRIYMQQFIKMDAALKKIIITRELHGFGKNQFEENYFVPFGNPEQTLERIENEWDALCADAKKASDTAAHYAALKLGRKPKRSEAGKVVNRMMDDFVVRYIHKTKDGNRDKSGVQEPPIVPVMDDYLMLFCARDAFMSSSIKTALDPMEKLMDRMHSNLATLSSEISHILHDERKASGQDHHTPEHKWFEDRNVATSEPDEDDEPEKLEIRFLEFKKALQVLLKEYADIWLQTAGNITTPDAHHPTRTTAQTARAWNALNILHERYDALLEEARNCGEYYKFNDFMDMAEGERGVFKSAEKIQRLIGRDLEKTIREYQPLQGRK